jgi:hypothetical protein
MKKLNEIIYNKLSLQAEEAVERGLTKLASTLKEAIEAESNSESYNYAELKDNLQSGLWKLATEVMAYYNVKSADVIKVDDLLESFADRLVEDLADTLQVDPLDSPREDGIPGEDVKY